MKTLTIKKIDKYLYEVNCDGIIEELQLAELVNELSTYLKLSSTKQIYNQIESYLVEVILRLSELSLNESTKLFPESTIQVIKESN